MVEGTGLEVGAGSVVEGTELVVGGDEGGGGGEVPSPEGLHAADPTPITTTIPRHRSRAGDAGNLIPPFSPPRVPMGASDFFSFRSDDPIK